MINQPRTKSSCGYQQGTFFSDFNQLGQLKIHKSAFSQAKRLIDILGALVGLVVTTLVFIPIAVAIYLDNPGPIFFGQLRSGLAGKPFRIYKFRTMVQGAEQQKHLIKNEVQGHLFKNSRDPRVTKVGKFLRRTSLDELPQFWNVLCGEMSLVGTRPPTLDEVEKYNLYHWRRLQVKPGMTGEWQVRGRSNIKNFEQVVALDLRYQAKWSLWYDLTIIFQTVMISFLGKDAH